MADDLLQWSELTEKAASLLEPKKYVQRFLDEKTRPDGRIFSQARETCIQQGILSKNAAGSALISLKPPAGMKGQYLTSILAAVTLQVGQPTISGADGCQQGDIVVANIVVEDEHYQQQLGTPLNTGVLQSFLQRCLDTCLQEIPDPSPLVLIPGSAALRLVLTLHILQDAGNLADACLLACLGALLDTRLPTADDISVEEGRVWLCQNVFTKKLDLPVLPIPLTMGLLRVPASNENKDMVVAAAETVKEHDKYYWLVDPNHLEEMYLSTILTIVVNGRNPEQILLLDGSSTSSDGGIRTTDLALAGHIATGRAQDLCSMLLS